MGLHHKDFTFDLKKITKQGSFAGYGSLFGVEDSYKEVVVAGAFKKTLARHKKEGRLPSMLWQHRSGEPIGIWTKMLEDAKGLYVEGQINLDVRRGVEAHSLMKQGAISGLSIGFHTVKSIYDETTNIRELLEVDLWEVSVVTFPALSPARISDVKSTHTQNDLEELSIALGLRGAALDIKG